MVHLFGIMIVNNWNTFYFAYQAVFGFALHPRSSVFRFLIFLLQKGDIPVFFDFLFFHRRGHIFTARKALLLILFAVPNAACSNIRSFFLRSHSSWKLFFFITNPNESRLKTFRPTRNQIFRYQRTFVSAASLRSPLCTSRRLLSFSRRPRACNALFCSCLLEHRKENHGLLNKYQVRNLP
jgi:hypothetical protein